MPTIYLAIDYGTRRTGLAVGNDLLKTAQAIATINTADLQQADGQIKTAAIEKIVQEWKIGHLVIGVPLGPEGEETGLSEKIRRFGTDLGQCLALPVSFTDERHSSGSADQLLRANQAAGKRLSRKQILARDSLAAQIILETFFSRPRPS